MRQRRAGLLQVTKDCRPLRPVLVVDIEQLSVVPDPCASLTARYVTTSRPSH